MTFFDVARKAKHGAFLATSAAKSRASAAQDAIYTKTTKPTPYRRERHLEADGWPAMDYFLDRVIEVEDEHREVPRRIFTAWTSREPAMPANRAAHLRRLIELNPDLEVVLVTPKNLDKWVVEGHPLHPAYEHLSAIHRSDYLRAYLLHHHGGAWSDLKEPTAPWAGAFDTMDADADAWVIGYPEQSSGGVVFHDSALGKQMRHQFATMAANCAFVVRPGTPFTAAWVDEIESRLSYYERALKRHPAQDPFGETGGYPLPWSVLQGHVFQPLQIRYPDHVRLDERLRPSAADHR